MYHLLQNRYPAAAFRAVAPVYPSGRILDQCHANHYATIRKWLDEDSKSKPGKNYDYTETYEEGECL